MKKNEVKRQLLKAIEVRANEVQSRISDLRSDLNSESKSTSGDKHETGRAMIQQEMENLGKQSENWNQMYSQADSISESACFKIELGSLFKMEDLWYYVSVSYGKLIIDETFVMCISPTSPLVQAILGATANSSFVFNQTKRNIQEIT
ncbi:MAG: hypothetical protein KJ941_02235 [Bacteroidetes bacterium]|nr:hypothetical protein [Bacteroidota bacterium]